MLTEREIEQFYKDFESMKLVKPVATMVALVPGLSSGNVSEYLSKKKKPSERFIRAFYEHIYKNSTNVPREQPDHSISVANEYPEPYGIKTDDKSMLAEMIRNNRILSEANKIHAQNVQALLIKVGISSDTFGEASAFSQGKGTASKKPFAELQDKTSSGSEKSHQKQKDILKS